jgi:ABC-type uncharacterized transport system YnjBCD ATPase subunit
VVRRVLEELELSSHAHTRVDKLSGGQRKRASVAMELLTGPSSATHPRIRCLPKAIRPQRPPRTRHATRR